MTDWQNGAEGVASGTTISTSNSATSGDAFTNFSVGAGNAFTFDSGQARFGSQSFKLVKVAGAASLCRWNHTTSDGTMRFRFYFYIPSAPTVAMSIARVYNSTTFMSQLQLSTGLAISYLDSGGTGSGTIATLSANTWYMADGKASKGASTSTGVLSLSIYASDGTTQLGTYSSSARNTGTTDGIWFQFGDLSSTGAGTVYFDALRSINSDGSEIGPFGSGVSLTAVPASSGAAAANGAVSIGGNVSITAVPASSSVTTATASTTSETNVAGTITGASSGAPAASVTTTQNPSLTAQASPASGGAGTATVLAVQNVSLVASPAGTVGQTSNGSVSAVQNVSLTAVPAGSSSGTASSTVVVGSVVAVAAVPSSANSGAGTATVTTTRNVAIVAVPASSSSGPSNAAVSAVQNVAITAAPSGSNSVPATAAVSTATNITIVAVAAGANGAAAAATVTTTKAVFITAAPVMSISATGTSTPTTTKGVFLTATPAGAVMRTGTAVVISFGGDRNITTAGKARLHRFEGTTRVE